MRQVTQAVLVTALTVVCSLVLLAVMSSQSVSASQIESVYMAIHGEVGK